MKKSEKTFFGCKKNYIFGRYRIAFFEETNALHRYGKDGIGFYKKIGKVYYTHFLICKLNILRKVKFDIKNQKIEIEVRLTEKKNFHKKTFDRITNKEFFNYLRGHIEDILYTYNVSSNTDRTEFKLSRKPEYYN